MADIFTLIQNAPDPVIRTVLAGLCSDREIGHEAYKMFGKIARASRTDIKRKLPPATLFICLNCKEAYSEAENASDACYYHNGNLEIDYDNDVWADHPDEVEMDTPDMRQDCPEGFVWDCCDGAADAPGCTRSWHQQGGAKRARFDPQPAVIHISSDGDEDSSGEDDDDTVTDESEEGEEAEEEEEEEEDGKEEAEDDSHLP
ncbi:hypothetical protein MFIFM68171_07670 [Madurella fahalii]|uniref:Uncharacterized protein n=1 Tax=Madurella fahalii TaxID=1157608 RepID=A0ABQ0GIT6_9PEZI